MIGAGVAKTSARAKEWLQIAPVVAGSFTPYEREQNPGQVLWPEGLEEFLATRYGLNSYGMPNRSVGQETEELDRHEGMQPLIVSVAGFEPRHYFAGALAVHQCQGATAVEFNLGCPNTQGEHSEITSFQPETVHEILGGVVGQGYRMPIWLKFSPYSNPSELKRMAELVNEFAGRLPLAVVTCNTFPNAYAGGGKITPNGGLAGLSGSAMKPIALGQVKQFRAHLDERIDVIGVGGATVADDIVDFIDAGAAAVQVVSLAHWAGEPRSFTNYFYADGVADRYFEYLETKTGRSHSW
jgi:dihydroorotate dehydrogenase (fumarate)